MNSYNVFDCYKNMSVNEIRQDVLSKTLNFGVLMEHWKGDFNISTLIRNANAFGAHEVLYIGKKGFDRRGTVGAHHYVNLINIKTKQEIIDLKKRYHFICFENNVKGLRPTYLKDYDWGSVPKEKMPLLIFGEEGTGITDQTMKFADDIITINQIGSVRSLNVGTCSGIAMHSIATYQSRKINV